MRGQPWKRQLLLVNSVERSLRKLVGQKAFDNRTPQLFSEGNSTLQAHGCAYMELDALQLQLTGLTPHSRTYNSQ